MFAVLACMCMCLFDVYALFDVCVGMHVYVYVLFDVCVLHVVPCV